MSNEKHSSPFNLDIDGYFEGLKRDLDKIKEHPDDGWLITSHVIKAFHLRDWVWKIFQHKLKEEFSSEKEFNTYSNNNSPYMREIRSLANRTKHFYKKDENDTETRNVDKWNENTDKWNEVNYSWNSEFLVECGNDEWQDACEIFRIYTNWWEQYVESLKHDGNT